MGSMALSWSSSAARDIATWYSLQFCMISIFIHTPNALHKVPQCQVHWYFLPITSNRVHWICIVFFLPLIYLSCEDNAQRLQQPMWSTADAAQRVAVGHLLTNALD
jgi:hypothetical protein